MSGARFSLKLSDKINKKPYYCSVSGCTSNSRKNRDLCFHLFPRLENKQTVKIKNYFGNFETVNRFNAWKNVLKMKKVNHSARICSLHFNYDDYTTSKNANKTS